MTARLIAAGGLAAALLACSAPPQAPAGHAPAPPVRASGAQPPPTRTFATDTAVGEVAGVVVIARDGNYRAGCQPELIGRVAARFTVAVAAEPGAALALAGPRFSAYSISERGTDRMLVARDRDGLDRLLRARAARHERQRLLALLVKPEGHLEFVGLRAADDLRRVTLTLGKGKVDCETATIAVLNGVDEGDAERLLGRPESLPFGWLPTGLAARARPIIGGLRDA
jgi:hypothetical protein